MSRLSFQLIQVMNIICATLVIFCCLVCLGLHGKAESNDGALSVVQQDDDNGIVENDNGDLDITPENYEPFQPTEEWQTVKKGQAIPAGLHVRMNLETGDKEAKLMDGESEYKYWRDGDRQGMMNMDRKQFSINELKKALKDFKTNELDDTYLQREAEVKKKFRSYKELKEDFAAMNMDIKTDGEIITDLVQKLQHKDIPRDDVITILQDLEYYLHQIDNGVLFKDIGGIPYILNMINRTDDEILQIEASMVLGAVTSSNPKVQIGALEAGSLQLLLRVISLNTSTNVKRKIIYCLSTLCRHFPYAQKKFLELGGLAALGNVFDEPGSEKVKVKIVSLLNDLLTEKILSLEHSNPELSTDSEKLKQYNQVHLKEAMIEQGWCERIVSLLKLQDHESREQVLNIMETLSTSCKTIFLKSKSELKTLQTEYSQLSVEELNISDGSDYFTLILGVINTVLSNIGIKDEL